MKPRLVFLPGATGDPTFWSPVARRLPADSSGVGRCLAWPGAGDQAHDPAIQSYDELTVWARERLGGVPSVLIAQSMGGVIAVRLAAEDPSLVAGLVLVATSGGVGPGVGDWRSEYRRGFPRAAAWVTEPVADQTGLARRITAPTLLVWGDSDPISPVSIGERLRGLISDSRLEVISGGDHDVAHAQPDRVAELIRDHLESVPVRRAG